MQRQGNIRWLASFNGPVWLVHRGIAAGVADLPSRRQAKVLCKEDQWKAITGGAALPRPIRVTLTNMMLRAIRTRGLVFVSVVRGVVHVWPLARLLRRALRVSGLEQPSAASEPAAPKRRGGLTL